ncbi:RNA-directed DNA polymerase [Chryseobacterium sp. AG844]|uniref:RNA-directed DNA polymerase n=1 Tax=Chryseobacterium sp. AG844 TaxID=2183998 RepID=UPI000D7194C7|nr:RNA-directed DNA polymerase [Chryseobacterium sp. AG844]PWW16975.1 reverse transcriptase (RNA-dependent DNA polymerase) [Chryseobacterium sp. AG844]
MIRKSKIIRSSLLNKGFFPEVLPPCFVSTNLARSFNGLIKDILGKQYHKRSSAYIRYSGTKHDGNRRYYGAVNPIPYFNLCDFIDKNWKEIDIKLQQSNFGISNIKMGKEEDDRAILVHSLSEVVSKLSSQIKHSPYLLKTDIAQFFPSIYTHSIVWAAHGREAAKKDTSRTSKTLYFNSLDWFIQQCQNGQTRGVIVGPDAFRIIAEYLVSDIDNLLQQKVDNLIIGGVRHVDDYYLGVKSEFDSSIVLSELRDILQNYELQVNDSKTQLLPGLFPIDDVWAQELRSDRNYSSLNDTINYLLDKAFDISNTIGSQSPMKLALRRLDKLKLYYKNYWSDFEPKLQRILFHFPHCLDYLCLLLAKRVAINKSIDKVGWGNIIHVILEKSIGAAHHHEIVWLLWVSFVCKIEVSQTLIARLCKINNSFVKSILIAAYQEGLCYNINSIKLGSNLSTEDETWLQNIVGRSTGYTGAKFSGLYATEFEQLVTNGVRFIDFKKHMSLMADKHKEAISKSKYGYDADNDKDEDEDEDTFNLYYDEDDFPF